VFNPLRAAHHLETQRSGTKLRLSLLSLSYPNDSADEAVSPGLRHAGCNLASDAISGVLAHDAASSGWAIASESTSCAPTVMETGIQTGYAASEQQLAQQTSYAPGETPFIKLWRPPPNAKDTAQKIHATANAPLASLLVTKTAHGMLVRFSATASKGVTNDTANLASLPSSNLSSLLGADTEASSSLASLFTHSSSSGSLLHASSSSSSSVAGSISTGQHQRIHWQHLTFELSYRCAHTCRKVCHGKCWVPPAVLMQSCM